MPNRQEVVLQKCVMSERNSIMKVFAPRMTHRVQSQRVGPSLCVAQSGAFTVLRTITNGRPAVRRCPWLGMRVITRVSSTRSLIRQGAPILILMSLETVSVQTQPRPNMKKRGLWCRFKSTRDVASVFDCKTYESLTGFICCGQ